MREEIESGLKNALDRGYTLDEAVASFINAGYNPVEVREAANNINSGATTIVNQNFRPVQSQTIPQTSERKIPVSNVFNPAPPQNAINQTSNSPSSQTPVRPQPQFQQTSAAQPSSPFQQQNERQNEQQKPVEPVQQFVQRSPQLIVQSSENSFNPMEQKKSGKKWLVIILIIVLVLLLGGLVGVILYSDELLSMLKSSALWGVYG